MLKWGLRALLILIAFAMIIGYISSAFALEGAVFDGSGYQSGAVILIDLDTGTVLYEKNADAKIAPASTTKILTAVLAMENLKLTDEITVPAEAKTSGTLMGLEPGNVVTVENLLYGMLICSGNDAAVTLAIAVSGDVDSFAALMNSRASELGMENSHFVTASGLDAEEHYVTVRDMAKLTQYFMTFEKLREIVATTKYTATTVDKSVSYPMENTNRLLHTPTPVPDANGDVWNIPDFIYEYATGLKTGSTTGAKGCLVATAEKDGQRLAALVFNDNSSAELERWQLTANLFDFGFDKYNNVILEDFAVDELMLSVENGIVIDGEAQKMRCIPMSEEGADSITLPAEISLDQIEYTVSPNEAISAPVEKGEVVGQVELKYQGEVLFSGKLAAADGMMTDEDYKKLTGTAEAGKSGVSATGIFQYILYALGGLLVILLAAVLFVRIKNNKKRKTVRLRANATKGGGGMPHGPSGGGQRQMRQGEGTVAVPPGRVTQVRRRAIAGGAPTGIRSGGPAPRRRQAAHNVQRRQGDTSRRTY